MDYKKIIDQLEGIRERSRNTANENEIDALTEAIDIIADYEKATAQNAEMLQRYELPEMAIRRQAGIYTCPLCGKRAQPGHTHCHWCGKKLTWNREAYASRDYPHMSSRKKGSRRENTRRST